MLQLAQKLKTGQIQILDVVLPSIQKNCLQVKNYYSLISAGTEASTVGTARKGYIGKAKERPQQAKQVIDTLKNQGVVQTYRAVMKKLDSYSPLGYSCAGEIMEVGPAVRGFKVGDLVACGGLSASHAEVVSVPANLCVKLKPGMDMKQATYNTLGAIALQGVRQADLRLGETCAIIGLGLLGQITGLLLKASGVKTLGIDIDPAMLKVADANCVDLTLHRHDNGIEDIISQFTAGTGCDAVIITAASSSIDPINFAGTISRKKGTIVVVGAVPTGFDREPHYYKKELQVKMSCSYGPGRYDPDYEEKGIDYPLPYVRWTENRNMMAFQELIYSNKIGLNYLTTHTFKLEDAPAAYDMMMSKTEPFIGILIEYDTTKKIDNKPIFSPKLKDQRSKPSAVSIGFIGAGSYAQSHLLPNIYNIKKVSLKGVMTSTSTSSRSVADRYGFEFCTGNEDDILKNDNINTIFIATRHNTHADFVLKALKAGKHVFVEKPLCLTEVELCQIVDLLNSMTTEDSASNLQPRASSPILMVGYNRRFSPLARRLKKEIGPGPMAMNYRINAGYIPGDSWIQDPETGGGRIIGEVCHFVDFLMFVSGSLPVSVHAAAMKEPGNLNDVLNVSLTFQNGSIGTISYFANGDKSLPKERVEIFANGTVAVLEDFKTLFIHAQGKKKKHKLLNQDKGQKSEVKQFVDAVNKGSGQVIPFDEIFFSSLTCFKIVESIRSGECLKL